MAEVELIGIPFDGFGRPGNQALASDALRRAGLAGAFRGHPVRDTFLDLPAPDPRRGRTGLLNESTLIAMVEALAERVGAAVEAARFPVVLGGDCATLLGTVAGLRSAVGRTGLVFVDGHEDTMPLDVSEDGEAANAELGLLLGITGRLLSGPLRDHVGLLGTGDVAVLGPRDAEWRRRFNVGSLRDLGVWLRDADEVGADPGAAGRSAAAHVAAAGSAWWLHVDLDVLDPTVFPAQGLPDVPDDPGGLTWDELTRLVTGALGVPGCCGCSLAIYDPEQDRDGSGARQIVALAERVAAAL